MLLGCRFLCRIAPVNTTPPKPVPSTSGSIVSDFNLAHAQSLAPVPSEPSLSQDPPTQNLTSCSLRTLALRLTTNYNGQ